MARFNFLLGRSETRATGCFGMALGPWPDERTDVGQHRVCSWKDGMSLSIFAGEYPTFVANRIAAYLHCDGSSGSRQRVVGTGTYEGQMVVAVGKFP